MLPIPKEDVLTVRCSTSLHIFSRPTGAEEVPYSVVVQYDGVGPFVPPTQPTFLLVGMHNVTVLARDRFGRQSTYQTMVCYPFMVPFHFTLYLFYLLRR
jgi:hypothetical protein